MLRGPTPHLWDMSNLGLLMRRGLCCFRHVFGSHQLEKVLHVRVFVVVHEKNMQVGELVLGDIFFAGADG